MKKQILFIAMLFWFVTGQAQVPQDLTFNVSTSFNAIPFRIILKWKPLSGDTAINVYRKYITAGSWTHVSSLAAADTMFTDSNAVAGTGYEYQIKTNDTTLLRYSYIYAGKDLPTVHYRGKMILLVDSNYVAPLSSEITNLIKDLIGDGWQVIRHNVSRTTPVTIVKSIVESDYMADQVNVNSLFILGHVPVPYSGDLNPDGHPDHKGAWPFDAFYGDMNGTYTDYSVNDTAASRPQNQNRIGDGKYDQSKSLGLIVLNIGRVDLYNMPSFTTNDTLLIQKYLNKDHAFKFKKINPRRQGLIDDNFGYFSGESFATSGWRNLYSLVGSDSTVAGDYFTGMKNQSYILAYGCGGGSYTSCGGVGATGDFVADTVQNIFTMLFGSYFGDWDSQDNFLRAPLASNGWTLTSSWSGRPFWEYQHLGLGEPIGFSANVTQNNQGLYYTNYLGNNFSRMAHIALMGDPSLRLHIIAPADSLKITAINSGSSAQLIWHASVDTVLGYYVYRADSLFGKFTLLTPSYISSTTYTDLTPTNGYKVYMVRAVKLEKAYTGTYYNLSEGIMDTLTIINSSVSIAENNSSDLQILLYPNPATNNLTIESPQQSVIEISNIQGQLLKTLSANSKKINIDISSLPGGVYVVEVKTQKEIVFKKFVKE